MQPVKYVDSSVPITNATVYVLQPTMAVKAFLVGEMRNGSVTVQPTVVPLELMVVDELKHRTYMRRGCRHTSPQFRQICS
jgi:hypothetical protein